MLKAIHFTSSKDTWSQPMSTSFTIRLTTYAWVSSTLNIVPDVLQITAKLPVGDIQVAQVSVKGVTLNGAHGPFTPEASTGNFSCTPSNVAVTLSRIAGSVGGNLVDDMNVRISPPTAVLPIVSGKLHAVLRHLGLLQSGHQGLLQSRHLGLPQSGHLGPLQLQHLGLLQSQLLGLLLKDQCLGLALIHLSC
eukprot:jgi/Mesen1/4541/ME000232S03798